MTLNVATPSSMWGSSLLKSHQMSQGSVALMGVVDPEDILML